MQQLLSNYKDSVGSIAKYAIPAGVGAIVLTKWYLDSRGLPPGPVGLPIIGALQVMDQSKLHKTIQQMFKDYDSDICSFRIGSQLVVALADYETIKECLDNPLFAGRPRIPIVERLTDNCGIIFTEGETWTQQRRTSLRFLRDFGFAREKSVEMIDNAVDALFDEMDVLAVARKPTAMLEMLLSASNSVVAQITFGRLFTRTDKDYQTFCDCVRPLIAGDAFSTVIMYPYLDYLLRVLPEPKGVASLIHTLHAFIRRIIREREAIVSDEQAQPECLCDAYILEKGKAERNGDFQTFRENQLIRVCFEIFLAGTDTTARSLEWLMLFMAFYPHVQKKVQLELDNTVGQSRRTRMNDRANLHYTCAVIDESYRKVSLAALGVFHRALEDTEINGYRVPKEAAIQPMVYQVHHDPKYWHRPDEFYPEHFLDERGNYKSSPYCIPFLLGRRSCLGESLAKMEVFMMFTAMMQRYQVEPTMKSLQHKDEIFNGHLGSLLSPKEYEIVLSKR